MTRENKLALVVGFGLILFVGILVSDHFSVVRSQAPANLSTQTLSDPLAVTVANISPANLIELKPLAPPEPSPESLASVSNANSGGFADEVMNPGYQHSTHLRADVLDADQPIRQGSPHITMEPTARPGDAAIPEGFEPVRSRANTMPTGEAAATFTFHDVQSGESMFAIAKRYYGTTQAIESLARFNKLDDPSSLRVGQRIRIPAAAELGLADSAAIADASTSTGASTNSSERPSSLRVVTVSQPSETSKSKTAKTSTPASKPRVTYTVKKGETLRIIALKTMGSKEKWNKLYQLNRDVIDDPDNLKVGTVLRLS